MVLKKTLECPLDCKELKPANHKGSQSWIFIGRTDARVETPILWPPDAKNWLIRKDPDAGKVWRWEEKERIEDEMVGWHHQLDEYEFEQTPGVGDARETWHAAVCGVVKSWTLLSDWTVLRVSRSIYICLLNAMLLENRGSWQCNLEIIAELDVDIEKKNAQKGFNLHWEK